MDRYESEKIQQRPPSVFLATTPVLYSPQTPHFYQPDERSFDNFS